MCCMAREGEAKPIRIRCSSKAKHGCVGRRCLARAPPGPGPSRPGTRKHNLARTTTTGLRRTPTTRGGRPPTRFPTGPATRGSDATAGIVGVLGHPPRQPPKSATASDCRPVSRDLRVQCPAAGGLPRVAPSGFQTRPRWGAAAIISHSRPDTSGALKQQPAGCARVFDCDWRPGLTGPNTSEWPRNRMGLAWVG